MIYSLLALLSILAALLEGFSFVGFVARHFFVPSLLIHLLSLGSSLFVRRQSKSSPATTYLVISFLLVYMILIFLETLYYPNFIYTHLHLNPVTFHFFLAVLIFHLQIFQGSTFPKSLLLAALIYVSVDGAGRTLGYLATNLAQMIQAPFASYSEKLASVYPGFYPAMQMVKQLTPLDSTIYIPPQANPWEIEGNAAMVTYFLYPRRVINLDPSKLHELDSPAYLLIAKGSWPQTGETTYGWPKVPVTSQALYQFDLSANQPLKYARSYDPLVDQFDWGLIEVVHD